MGRKKSLANRPICPVCTTKKLVPAYGPADADILLVGSYPGRLEIAKGIPWIGRAGEVLESELDRAGIQISKCRITNLWMHAPPKELTKLQAKKGAVDVYAKELSWHMKQMLAEFYGKKALFLMGAELVETLGLGSVSNLSGMVVKSDWFPDSVKLAVVSVNPAQALRELLGETRFAIERFATELWRLRNEDSKSTVSDVDTEAVRDFDPDVGGHVHQGNLEQVVSVSEHRT